MKNYPLPKRYILSIVPLYISKTDENKIKKDLEKYSWEGTKIEVIGLRGNIAVNSSSEASIALKEFLEVAIRAEREKYDAIISYCYVDVGVDAANVGLNIPIVGPLESSALFASILGDRFSVITVGTAQSLMQPRLRKLALDKNFVSTRGIDFEDFFVFSADERKNAIMQKALEGEFQKAVDDGAHVFILGCTGFPIADKVKERFNVPIVDGLASLKTAEVLVDLNKIYSNKGHNKTNENLDIKGKNTRIKVIVPTSNDSSRQEIQMLRRIANKGTVIEPCYNIQGPESMSTEMDIAQSSRFTVEESVKTLEEGYDSLIIHSFVDPNIRSAREILDIPVVGPGESSMLFASRLGRDFSVINNDPREKNLIKNVARKIGVENRLLSIKSFNGEGLRNGGKIIEEARTLVEEGAASLIYAGKDGLRVTQLLKEALEIQILEPYSVALKTLEAMHSLGLSHSKVSYPYPELPDYHVERIKKIEKVPEDCMFIYKKMKKW